LGTQNGIRLSRDGIHDRDNWGLRAQSTGIAKAKLPYYVLKKPFSSSFRNLILTKTSGLYSALRFFGDIIKTDAPATS
jgi:hypothetical protein